MAARTDHHAEWTEQRRCLGLDIPAKAGSATWAETRTDSMEVTISPSTALSSTKIARRPANTTSADVTVGGRGPRKQLEKTPGTAMSRLHRGPYHYCGPGITRSMMTPAGRSAGCNPTRHARADGASDSGCHHRPNYKREAT